MTNKDYDDFPDVDSYGVQKRWEKRRIKKFNSLIKFLEEVRDHKWD